MNEHTRKKFVQLVKLLRAKAGQQATQADKNENNKGFWQAGKADAWYWAADHIELIIKEYE